MERASSLPGLPPEMRERIYSELLEDHPLSLVRLLAVNRCISDEVKPWIFKQEVTFNGQQRLFRWLPGIDPAFLPYVERIRFKLHDIDAGKIVGSLDERLRRASVQDQSEAVGDPYGEACDRELSDIMAILKSLKNLKSIRLLDSTGADPRPPLKMRAKLVDLILQDLHLAILSVPHEASSKLNRFSDSSIQCLQITNYALIKSPELPRRITSFFKLSKIHLCSDMETPYAKSTFHLKRQDYRYRSTDEMLSQLHDVTLCLHDTSEAEAMPDAVAYKALERFFITFDIRATSLKTFRLRCNRWIGRTSSPMLEITRFIQSSSLTHVETGYWWTPFWHQYPSSVDTIAVQFDTNFWMFPNWTNRLFTAISSKHNTFFTKYPALKEIVLYLPPQARVELKHAESQEVAVAAICREHGVKLRLVYQDFSCNR
ncbi:MAG: hypothetical protein Q9170_003954 [Blastenia crenularia]